MNCNFKGKISFCDIAFCEKAIQRQILQLTKPIGTKLINEMKEGKWEGQKVRKVVTFAKYKYIDPNVNSPLHLLKNLEISDLTRFSFQPISKIGTYHV